MREVAGDDVTIDFNHPFAGRELRVWLLVRSVRPPTAAEATETADFQATRERRAEAGSPASGEIGPSPTPIIAGVATAPAAAPSKPAAAPTTPVPAAPEVTVEDVQRLGLRVGVVRNASRVKGTDRLLQLEVDLGTEQRTLVAGIAARYAPEAIVGRSIIVVSNLKPATIRGIQSRGMLLAAVGADGRPIIASFEEAPPPGTEVR